VLAIALVLLTYGLTASLGGSGFLAVYLVGLLLGNSSVQRVDRLSHFHDGLVDANRDVLSPGPPRLPLTPSGHCGERTADSLWSLLRCCCRVRLFLLSQSGWQWSQFHRTKLSSRVRSDRSLLDSLADQDAGVWASTCSARGNSGNMFLVFFHCRACDAWLLWYGGHASAVWAFFA
jgi:hypothetical protein